MEAYCQRRGQAFIRFDYSGHGDSGGDFGAGNISQWMADTLAILDHVNHPQQILVGSSMGAWIALLAALRRPRQVCGLLLIACAADMTKYYPARLAGLAVQKDALQRPFYSVPNEFDNQQDYLIYQQLIDDGSQHFLLDQNIVLDIPVRLLHGMQDDVVPWQRSQQVLEKLTTTDASLHLLKAGDHRLSGSEDIKLIEYLLANLLEKGALPPHV